MIIQRKVNVPGGQLWEDIVENDYINPLDYLEGLDHSVGTEYRIIFTAGTKTRHAIVTQPPKVRYCDDNST